jgi:hypothetical protein
MATVIKSIRIDPQTWADGEEIAVAAGITMNQLVGAALLRTITDHGSGRLKVAAGTPPASTPQPAGIVSRIRGMQSRPPDQKPGDRLKKDKPVAKARGR